MDDEVTDPTGELVGSQFCAVSFVWDYLHLFFQGPQPGELHFVHAETHPRVRVSGRWYEWGGPGYRDALCDQFGTNVRDAETEIEVEQIAIRLDNNDTVITISLRREDFATCEAATYTHHIRGQVRGQSRGMVIWGETGNEDWKRMCSQR